MKGKQKLALTLMAVIWIMVIVVYFDYNAMPKAPNPLKDLTGPGNPISSIQQSMKSMPVLPPFQNNKT